MTDNIIKICEQGESLSKQLECDGTVKVLHYLLKQNNIPHKVIQGEVIDDLNEDAIPLHFWIEIGEYLVDYKARMWLDNNAPNGVFKRKDFPYYIYNGDEININVSTLIFKILTEVKQMNLSEKILKEAELDVLDKKITNPDTGRKIKVSSALSYDKSDAVYKKAKSMVGKGTDKPLATKQTAPTVKKLPSKGKSARSHKPKSKSYGVSKECALFLKEKGLVGLSAYPQSFVKTEEIIFNPELKKKGKDKVWVIKFPFILKNGQTGMKQVYSAKFMKASQIIKNKKVAKIKATDIERLDVNTKKLLKSIDKKIADSSAVIRTILKTGLRVGSVDNPDTGNIGVRTLLAENIHLEGDKISLKFIGKSYQDNIAEFEDRELADYFKKLLKTKQPKQRAFGCTYNEVMKVMDKINPKGINPKDLRTYKGTEVAKACLKDEAFGPPLPLPKDSKQLKPLIKEKLKNTFIEVARILNNSPTMARNSYVLPIVITDYLDSLGVTPREVGYKHITLEGKQLKESILSTEEKILVNQYVQILKTVKAGEKRKEAVRALGQLAQTKTKSTIRSVSDALNVLDYVEPSVFKRPSTNTLLSEELSSKILKEAEDSEVTFTSMDEMFDKFPETEEVDEEGIDEEDIYECEEYELPQWFWDDNWELVYKNEI